MAFSYLVRSSLARALVSPDFMHRLKSFRLNPSSLLANSSGSHPNNNHRLSSSTVFRFFSAQTTTKERGSELVDKETTFGDGKGKKSDQSNNGGDKSGNSSDPVLVIFKVFCAMPLIFYMLCMSPRSAYEEGVEEKNKRRFEEFKVKLLEPGFVSKIIVVDHSLALVFLKDNPEVGRVSFEPEQPIEKGVYLLDIRSPESFKAELEQTHKILGLHSHDDSVQVIDLTEYPIIRKERSAPRRNTMKWHGDS